jgi:hypothetical protein
MNFWPKGIIIAFVLFAAFIIVLVTISMKQDISLDTKNYYQEELIYQQKINAIQNAKKLVERPLIAYDEKTQMLQVSFPKTENAISGTLWGYKPDISSQDFQQQFQNSMTVPMRAKAKGLWKIKLNWRMASENYYMETPLIIP